MPFGKSKNSKVLPNADNPLLRDLPRGVEGRVKTRNWLPHQFFESPEKLAIDHRYGKRAGEIFLGIANGKTQEVLRSDNRKEYLVDGGTMIGSIDDRHLLTVAGSRSGKGRSAIIPNLLTYDGSVFSIDPKGDHARLTARHRAEVLGQKVCIVDPFGLMPESLQPYVKRFNPLSILPYDSPTIVEDAGLIASALIIPEGKDPHWHESARALVEGLILHVATGYQFIREERTLPTVYDLIAGRIVTLKKLWEEMLDNNCLEGRIATAAQIIKDKEPPERSGIISTVRRNLKFLDYDPIRETLDGSDFEFEDLKREKLTIYMCLPVMRMTTCSPLLRVGVNLTLAAMERTQSPHQAPVLTILDEFPVLGHMQELETAIGYMAGLGVKLWIFLQDISQLQALYNKRWETFVGNAGVIQAFGNSELATTEFMSKRLGQTVVSVINQSSVSRDQRNQQGATGMNQNQQVQSLLTAEEISQYFARDDYLCRQLIIQPGKRPWVLQRANYDHHSSFKNLILDT